MANELSEDGGAKQVLEKLYGRQITDEEWVKIAPDPSETIDDTARYIQPRLMEYAFEFAAVNGVGAISDSIAGARAVQTYVKNVRWLIFGTEEIPFCNLEDAWDWIWAEIESEQGIRFSDIWFRQARRVKYAAALLGMVNKRAKRHFAKSKTPYKLTEDDRRLYDRVLRSVDLTKLNPLVELMYKKYKGELGQRDSRYTTSEASGLFVVADSRVLANVNRRIPYEEDPDLEKFMTRPRQGMEEYAELPRTYAEWLQRLGMFGIPDDHVNFAGPTQHIAGENETHITACTEKLVLLGTESRWIAEHIAKGWSQGQAATYILTGIIPKLPRMRIWIEELPGHGKRAFVELIGSFNHKEMRELHRLIREQTGTIRKKSLTPSDLKICDHVQAHLSMTWSERLEIWNQSNPDRQFSNTSGLINAFNRASKRLAQP